MPGLARSTSKACWCNVNYWNNRTHVGTWRTCKLLFCCISCLAVNFDKWSSKGIKAELCTSAGTRISGKYVILNIDILHTDLNPFFKLLILDSNIKPKSILTHWHLLCKNHFLYKKYNLFRICENCTKTKHQILKLRQRDIYVLILNFVPVRGKFGGVYCCVSLSLLLL